MIEERHIVNGLVRQVLLATRDVLGENGLHEVLRVASLERFCDQIPPDDLLPGIQVAEFARFNQAVEEFYGRAGKGILQRIGRACFHYEVREQAVILAIAGVALKVLPQKQRIKFILTSLVSALKKTNPGLEVWAGEMDGKLVYIDQTCAICYGRTSERPICHLHVGSIREAVKWASGKAYAVVETHCVAKGDPDCRFEIQEPR